MQVNHEDRQIDIYDDDRMYHRAVYRLYDKRFVSFLNAAIGFFPSSFVQRVIA
ncbi:MAG: hypothetical protein ACTSUE_11745 [Promethearchaeota archaeon]